MPMLCTRLYLRPALLAVAGFLFLNPMAGTAQNLYEAEEGLPAVVDTMYLRGLRFLAASQNAEGFWSGGRYGEQPGVVGLAVVSMLAHGDDPNTGPFGENIHRGLNYILAQMNETTGFIGTTMYNHGFAALALAEAYGEVDLPGLGPALQKAVDLLLESQANNPHGAWRYNPDSQDADTTVTGCAMVALLAARNAGIAVPESAIQKGIDFFLKCQHESGGFGYTTANAPNAARTAIGCLVLKLARRQKSPAWQRGFAFLQKQPIQRSYYYYFLYYASQANFHASPEAWRTWNRENIERLRQTQNEDGEWEGQFGAVFSTSAALLSLALNYRYLPIYER